MTMLPRGKKPPKPLKGVGGYRWASKSLTWSVMPTGVPVGDGMVSRLPLYWSSRGVAEKAWMQELRYAFLVWARSGGFVFKEVPDDGSPADTPGKCGQIRLGSAPLVGAVGTTNWRAHSGVIEYACSYMSTRYSFGLVVNPPTYDEQTTFLHEVGHSLGLQHSTDPASVMYPVYQGRRTQPTPADIQTLRSLYA